MRLDKTGADGLVPIRTLGSDYFRHDRDRQTLEGERTGVVLGIGQRVSVRLIEATPITGGLILELLQVDGASLNRGGARRTGGRRKLPRGKVKSARRRRR